MRLQEEPDVFLVRQEEVEEKREEILSLVRSQTNQEVKYVVLLFLQEKVNIFLVVPPYLF